MKISLDTSIPIQFDELVPIPDERFVRGKIWICHTGENRNRSYFSKESILGAISSLANIPVLGFIQVDKNNETDFTGHEQRIVIDKDGARIEYLGRMYGIVPETNNAKFETKVCEDGVEREFLTAEVLLHTKFQECIEIVQRDGIHSHSMELYPDSIQGKFNKNGIFEFSSFKFEGLCLLGENVTPAMIDSKLELFNQFNFNEQLKEMLNEFNSNFSQKVQELHCANSIKENNSEEIQGGEKVNKKLELFEKFPTLKEEVVASLKENIDQYSLEELEAKLNELFSKQEEEIAETSDDSDNVNNSFTLTAKQFESELRRKLSEYQHTDRWGDTCRQYWYIDHDENRVYAEDGKNNYLPVGISYSKNGDSITLDIDSAKRIKWVPQDIDGESEQVVTLMSVERGEFDFSKSESIYSDYKNSAEEKFTEMNTLISEQEKSLTQNDEKIENLNSLYEEMKVKYSKKLEEENQEKLNNLFNSFSKDLTQEEITEIRESTKDSSFEDIETKLFALVGKKKAKFSTEDKKNPIIDLQLDRKLEPKIKTGKSYDELFEKYNT